MFQVDLNLMIGKISLVLNDDTEEFLRTVSYLALLFDHKIV